MNGFCVGYISDRGVTHPINQDSILVKSFSDGVQRTLIAGLFDGMGGHSEGERVSGASAQAIAAWANANKGLLLSGEKARITQSLRLELDRLNEKIRTYGKRTAIEAGTTAAILIANQDSYLCCNVGDSRIYHITEVKLKQITEDQSLVADLVRAGLLNEDQAKTHPQRNVLTQALGILEKITPAFHTGKYGQNDVFVLCCDGFYHELTDTEIQSLYRAEQETQKINALLIAAKDLVISRGETDNITGILIKATSEG